MLQRPTEIPAVCPFATLDVREFPTGFQGLSGIGFAGYVYDRQAVAASGWPNTVSPAYGIIIQHARAVWAVGFNMHPCLQPCVVVLHRIRLVFRKTHLKLYACKGINPSTVTPTVYRYMNIRSHFYRA